jgi:hypothetical protein
MNPNKHHFWKVVAIVLIVAGFIGQVWSHEIWNRYLDTLPRSPDVAAGRTHRDDNFHGYVLYETREEHFRLYAIEYSSEGLVFLGLLVGAFGEWRTRRARMRPDE